MERSRLFSVISAALAFSPAIGPVLGGLISQYLGWRFNFHLLVAMGGLLFVWSLLALPETRPLSMTRMTGRSLHELLQAMLSSRQLWGNVFLIGGTNAILLGFYQEAPFVFIEQMGMGPSHYGLFGLLIAAATVAAARFTYRKSGHFTANAMINFGACGILIGVFVFLLIVWTGIFHVEIIGLWATIVALFVVFFGIGLVIPNSLSQALKSYAMVAGTAGSIFGGCYYCMIAGCTWMMSVAHNGTVMPLPLYMVLMGALIFVGSRMAVSQRCVHVTEM